MKKHAAIKNYNANEKLGNAEIARLMSITVKAVVLDEQERVLLLKRSKKEKTNKEMWDLPGGTLEKDQTIEESLAREVWEETGIKIEPGLVIRVVEFEKNHKAFKQEKRGLRYLVRTKNTKVKLSSEHIDYIWLPFEQAIEKFSDKKSFEKEKKETLIVAKEYLKMQKAEDNWKRALADFDNFKKRTERSNLEFRKFCLEGIVTELLPVLDNFEMATGHVPEQEKTSAWVAGILHIQNQLNKVLEEQGVKEIPVEENDMVNEEIHHIIAGKTSEETGRVKKVLKKGYQMDGKVIRPANIEVA